MSTYNDDKIPIKFWEESERPREKMILHGANQLSDAELLAILIGSGNTNESAVALMLRILKDADNNLNQLARMGINGLLQYKGIGEAKAITIQAALELAGRRERNRVKDKVQVRSSNDIYKFFTHQLSDLPHEEFWVLYLNRSLRVLAKERLSVGGISGTVVDIRILLKRALELLSASIVLIHNHPSGNLNPSDEDRTLTRKIKEAAHMLDIRLNDHIIISTTGYYSFADAGLI